MNRSPALILAARDTERAMADLVAARQTLSIANRAHQARCNDDTAARWWSAQQAADAADRAYRDALSEWERA
jgi:hypothetical protein